MGSGGPGGCRPGIKELPTGKSGLGREGGELAGLGADGAGSTLTPLLLPAASPGHSQELCPSNPLVLQGKSHLVPPQMVRDSNVRILLSLQHFPSPLSPPGESLNTSLPSIKLKTHQFL